MVVLKLVFQTHKCLFLLEDDIMVEFSDDKGDELF